MSIKTARMQIQKIICFKILRSKKHWTGLNSMKKKVNDLFVTSDMVVKKIKNKAYDFGLAFN